MGSNAVESAPEDAPEAGGGGEGSLRQEMEPGAGPVAACMIVVGSTHYCALHCGLLLGPALMPWLPGAAPVGGGAGTWRLQNGVQGVR